MSHKWKSVFPNRTHESINYTHRTLVNVAGIITYYNWDLSGQLFIRTLGDMDIPTSRGQPSATNIPMVPNASGAKIKYLKFLKSQVHSCCSRITLLIYQVHSQQTIRGVAWVPYRGLTPSTFSCRQSRSIHCDVSVALLLSYDSVTNQWMEKWSSPWSWTVSSWSSHSIL